MKTQMLKAESTGISSDFGGNPESTDVRAVRVMEKADEDDDGDYEKAASKMPASTGEALDPPPKAPPSQEEQQAGRPEDDEDQAPVTPAKKPNPFQKAIPGADAPAPEGSILGDEGDPEGKNLDTSDDAALQASQRMLNAGLKGWLAKAEGEEDEEVDPEADPNDLSDEDDGMITDLDTVEKAGGEGSRGGRIIGHTSSGKPIYERGNAGHYDQWSKVDHRDAENAHSRHSEEAHERSKKAWLPSKKKEHAAQSAQHKERATYHQAVRHLAESKDSAGESKPRAKVTGRQGSQIGTTSTGKPVHTTYIHSTDPQYGHDFTPAEHREAAEMHRKKEASLGGGRSFAMTRHEHQKPNLSDKGSDAARHAMSAARHFAAARAAKDTVEKAEGSHDEEMEGLSAQGDMEKASYTKRTGTPGHYKYEYAGAGKPMSHEAAGFGSSNHAALAHEAEARGDIAGAIEHHRAGMKADDDRFDAAADWQRGDPIGNGKGFAAHNEALKRLGSPHHEPDPSNRPGVREVKKGNMTEFQKTGLNGWLKACSIPGAEDTSDGKDPAWGLPDGAPALDQGADVNGAMIDGLGREDRAQANGNDAEDTTGSVDSGKGVSLSADDPAFGAMASGEPGCEHGTPEMSGSIGQGKGADLGGSLRGPGGTGGDLASLSKSRGFLPDRNDIYEQRSALARLQARGRGPADLRGVGVGRAGPRAAQVQGPAPTVIRKGQVVYSDASDLAVDAVMQKGDDSFFQNAGGISELRKSESCSSCGTAKPVWLSHCPECGGHAARAQLQKSEQPQGRLRLRVERDLVLPEGTKRTR